VAITSFMINWFQEIESLILMSKKKLLTKKLLLNKFSLIKFLFLEKHLPKGLSGSGMTMKS